MQKQWVTDRDMSGFRESQIDSLKVVVWQNIINLYMIDSNTFDNIRSVEIGR